MKATHLTGSRRFGDQSSSLNVCRDFFKVQISVYEQVDPIVICAAFDRANYRLKCPGSEGAGVGKTLPVSGDCL